MYELISGDDELRSSAGLQDVDLLASAGHYERRGPIVLNLDEQTALGAKYREDLNRISEYYPPLFRTVLHGATVTGQGTVVTRDHALIVDSCWEMLEQQRTPEGLERLHDDALRLRQPPSRRIERPSLLLKRPWWRNYGHWLLDTAAMLALLPGLAMQKEWQIVMGRHDEPKMRQIAYEALSFLAPSVTVLEHQDHETWVFDELHYTTPVSKPPLFKLPQATAALRAFTLFSSSTRTSGRKLYVARPADKPRRLDNEEAVIELCLARGFEVVRPEVYSLRQQAQLFNSADIIVGVKGAALTNLVFCTSSASVVVLSPASWREPFFWDIAGQLGMKYVEVIGPVTGEADNPARVPFEVDLQLVRQALAEVEAADTERRPTPWQIGNKTGELAGKAEISCADAPSVLCDDQPVCVVMAHIHNVGDVQGGLGDWLGSRGSGRWVEGFQISPVSGVAADEIEYQAIEGIDQFSEWTRGGTFCGTRGLSLPLRGLRVRLRGAMARRFDCAYTATFADGTEFGPVVGEEDCAAGSLAPLEALRITLCRRGDR